MKDASEMDTQVTNVLRDDGWDKFVFLQTESHYSQTSLWAQVRRSQGWDTLRIIGKDGGEIVAGAQILMRPVPPMGWAAYIPFGVINPSREIQVYRHLFHTILNQCNTKHILYLAVPMMEKDDRWDDFLRQFGFGPTIFGDIDPPCNIRIDLSQTQEKIQGRMERNKRNQIRASQRRGLVFRMGDKNQLSIFYDLHTNDARRLGYVPFSWNFFQQLWDIYVEKDKINLFFTEWDGRIINALLCIKHGKIMTAFKIGSSGEEMWRYPSEAIHFGAMLWAKEHGMHFYDFDGFMHSELDIYLKGKPYPDHFRKTYAYFKIQMGGRLIIYPPLYDYITNPFFNLLYRKLYPVIKDYPLYRKLFLLYKYRTRSEKKAKRLDDG